RRAPARHVKFPTRPSGRSVLPRSAGVPPASDGGVSPPAHSKTCPYGFFGDYLIHAKDVADVRGRHLRRPRTLVSETPAGGSRFRHARGRAGFEDLHRQTRLPGPG